MKRLSPKTILAVTAVVIVVAAGGCGRKHFFVETGAGNSGVIPTGLKLSAPRGLAMFSGHTARRLAWDDVRNAMRWADVILVGEQHDDAVAHQTRVLSQTVVKTEHLAPLERPVEREMLRDR